MGDLQTDQGEALELRFVPVSEFVRLRAAAADPAGPGTEGAGAEITPEKASEALPMLVTACQLRPGKDRVVLSFRTENGQSVALDLSFDMLHGLCRLIQQAAGSADWALNLELGAPAQPSQVAGPVH